MSKGKYDRFVHGMAHNSEAHINPNAFPWINQRINQPINSGGPLQYSGGNSCMEILKIPVCGVTGWRWCSFYHVLRFSYG